MASRTLHSCIVAATFGEAERALGVAAGQALNEAYRRRICGEPDPPVPIERFDFTKPPGHFRDLAPHGLPLPC